MAYPGIYKARCVADSGLLLTTYVPQVFGKVAVKVAQVAGPRPGTGDFGFISFLGGDPEYPVWLGSGGSAQDGAAGEAGAAGAIGATGVGASGVIGASGPTGASGAQGPTGVGATGVTGSTGPPGATGVAGATGAPAPGVGSITEWPTHYVPADNFACDGTTRSRTTYAGLFSVVVPVVGTFTVTIATPGVFTLNAHGLWNNDAVYLTTTGSLPTGLAQNQIYFVSSTATNTFRLSNSRGGAEIATTGSQSGVHTIRFCPWGLGDGSSTFNLPFMNDGLPHSGATSGGQVIGQITGIITDGGSSSGLHTHTNTVGGETVDHGHTYSAACAPTSVGTKNTGGVTAGHQHVVTINNTNSAHTHTMNNKGSFYVIRYQ